ncbi:MFS transporter [Nocardia abscessus]|uniref:MFS transporter n=1 Tax=Nocardia abscessus TaxID=120957 RepID=UPI002457E38B|nr:MFS transporter [Nocardia abscessus]
MVATACLATFVSLDAAVVNMAVGPIAADLSASTATVAWTVSAYSITFAAGWAAAGQLADAVDHRVVLWAGIAVFAGASGVCAASPDLAVLVGARAAQGAGAAMLLPAALAALPAASAPTRSAAMTGAWSATGAAALGPVVGAALVDVWGWWAIFVVNLPLCLVLAAVSAVLPPGRRRLRGLPDVSGAVGLSMGVGAVAVALAEGGDWDPLVRLLVVSVGVAATAAVVARSGLHPRPALPVRLWRKRRFAMASVVSFGLGAGFVCYLLAAPLLLTSVWGVPLLVAAACVGSTGVEAMLAAAVVSRVITQSSARWWCAGGMLSVAAGFAVLSSPAVGAERAWPAWGMVVALLGLGMGAAVTAVSVICADVPDAREYVAAVGLNLTTGQLGGAIGIATAAAVVSPERFLGGFHAVFALVAVLSVGAAVAAAGFLRPPASATSPTPISAAAGKECARWPVIRSTK